MEEGGAQGVKFYITHNVYLIGTRWSWSSYHDGRYRRNA